MVYACGSAGWLVATGRLAVRFMHPVPVDVPLELHGEVVNQRKKLITARGKITYKGKVLADAESTMAAMRPLTPEDLRHMQAIRSFTAVD